MKSRDWFALALCFFAVECAKCDQLQDIEGELLLLRLELQRQVQSRP